MTPRIRLTLTGAILTILAIGLGACQLQAVRPAAETPAPTGVADIAGAARYEVDSAASEVRVLVYRGGTMARLGHNHVLSSRSVRGTLHMHRDIARSSFELTLPVLSLIVDDPQAREMEGAEFAAEVPEAAREGTRHNLQRPEVLDAERYPTILLQSTGVSGTHDKPVLQMRVTLKGVTRDETAFASVKEEGDRLIVDGEFTIQQTDYGITPFSVALGALQVKDQLLIKFAIVCRRQR